MKEIKRVLLPWFAWNTAKIENYLERMAAEGWQIDKVAFSQIWFRFKKEEPETIRFCADFQLNPNGEYFQILKDGGWKLINQSGGWMFWCKPYNGIRPELYTERESLIERNGKLIFIVSLVLMIQFPVLSDNGFDRLSRRFSEDWSWIGDVLVGVYAFLLFFLVYGLIRLIIANRLLHKDHL